MDFSLSTAQVDLAGLVRTICKDLTTGGDGRDAPALWRELARSDVLSAALPEAAGGSGLGLLEQCGVLEELGRAVAGVPYRETVAVAGTAIAERGTPEQVAEWLAPALRGELVLTAALTDADGSDPEQPSTRAEPDGDGWVLTGTKSAVPSGTAAGVLLVSATTPSGGGLFAVTPSDAGVSIAGQRLVDDAEDAAWVELSGVRVPAGRRVGGSSDEADVLPWLVRRATVAVCAEQVGVLEGALELTAAYASTRAQFGRPIGSFQAVSQRLADAYIDVRGARLTMWQAASDPTPEAVATAKFWAAEAGHRVAHTCVHVHGGAGIDMDGSMHRYFTAAKRLEFELGGATTALRHLGAALAR
jgi:alkylation response protein AidB-like acyl-CoA dehydrogenase